MNYDVTKRIQQQKFSINHQKLHPLIHNNFMLVSTMINAKLCDKLVIIYGPYFLQ